MEVCLECKTAVFCENNGCVIENGAAFMEMVYSCRNPACGSFKKEVGVELVPLGMKG